MTVTLSATPNTITGVAPLVVQLDMTATTSTQTSRPFHHVAYLINFGDLGSAYNLIYSALGTHCYETPGVYTLGYWAMDQDGVAYNTVTITVTDPDTVFATTDTIVVADITGNEGTYPSVVTGQTEVDSADFDAAMGNWSPGQRILFRVGDTFTYSGSTTLDAETGESVIGSCGTKTGVDARGIADNLPIITGAVTASPIRLASGSATTENVKIMDLDFRTTAITPPTAITFGDGIPNKITALHCKCEGYDDFIVISSGVTCPQELFVFQCESVDNLHYHIFADVQNAAYVGNNFDGIVAGGEHVLRTQRADNVFIHDNILHGATPGNHHLKIVPEEYVAGASSPGGRVLGNVWVSNNDLSGACGYPSRIGNGSSGHDERGRDYLFDGNTFTLFDGDNAAIYADAIVGLTVRNSKILSAGDLTVAVSFVNVVNSAGSPTPDPAYHEIDHNSAYIPDAIDDFNFVRLEVHDSSPNLQASNNLVYAPNLTDDYMIVRNAGSANFDYVTNYPAADVLNGAWGSINDNFNNAAGGDLSLNSGSTDAIGQATFVDVWTDDDGGERDTSTPDIGYDEYGATAWDPPTGTNTAPTASNGSFSVDYNGSHTLTASEFNYSDEDEDTLDHVQITTLETAGALQLDGVDVTLNQEISKANIDSGLLTFEPTADESGTPYTTFGFHVNDGTDDSESSYTMTINVLADQVTKSPGSASSLAMSLWRSRGNKKRRMYLNRRTR